MARAALQSVLVLELRVRGHNAAMTSGHDQIHPVARPQNLFGQDEGFSLDGDSRAAGWAKLRGPP
jgi:hypothetical protein